MSYMILYEKAVVKFLKKQPEEQQRRIMEAIHALPERGDIKQLKVTLNCSVCVSALTGSFIRSITASWSSV